MISPRKRGAILLVLALGIGAVAGAMAERLRAGRMLASSMEPDVLMKTFDRELALDPAQHEAIERVLQRHQVVIDSAWKSLRPSVRAAIDSSQMEIVRILHPDQQVRFIELLRVNHPGMTSAGAPTGEPRP
jgi:hypothetical protein